MIDLTKLTPAPWVVIPEKVGDCGIFGGSELSWVAMAKNPAETADAEFIALARNAFDVIMRRFSGHNPWRLMAYTGYSHEAGVVRVFMVCTQFGVNDLVPFDVQSGALWRDPYTAIVEADKWYVTNIEKGITP